MTEKNKKQMESDHILSREERIQEIQSFNLLSDVFMSVALDDIPACQHILRILTGMDDLKVKTVRTQYAISRIKTHSVRLDVLAETEKGKLYRKGSCTTSRSSGRMRSIRRKGSGTTVH